MATQPNDIKVALIALANVVSSLVGDVAYLKAEHSALLEIMKTSTPELYDKLENLRHQDTYRTDLNVPASALANVSDALRKVSMMGFDTWASLLKQ